MHQVFEMPKVNKCMFYSSESMLRNMPYLPEKLHLQLLILLDRKIGGIFNFQNNFIAHPSYLSLARKDIIEEEELNRLNKHFYE